MTSGKDRPIISLRHDQGIDEIEHAIQVGGNRSDHLPVRVTHILNKLNSIDSTWDTVAADDIRAVALVADSQVIRGSCVHWDSYSDLTTDWRATAVAYSVRKSIGTREPRQRRVIYPAGVAHDGTSVDARRAHTDKRNRIAICVQIVAEQCRN